MLSESELADLARQCHKEATAFLADHLFPAPIKKLIEDRKVRSTHREAVKMLKKVIAVDPTTASNRKGEFARALGLQLDRRREELHLAINLAVRRLRDYSFVDARKRCNGKCSPRKSQWRCPHRGMKVGHECVNSFAFPYSSKRAAATAVVSAFYHSGLHKSLTAENVDKIVQRHDPFA